jgi:hypothetical protein
MILDGGRAAAGDLVAEGYRAGVDPMGVGYSPGSLHLDMAPHALETAREQAALHLFAAAAREYLAASEVEALACVLYRVAEYAASRYRIDPGRLGQAKRHWLAQAHRRRASSPWDQGYGMQFEMYDDRGSALPQPAGDLYLLTGSHLQRLRGTLTDLPRRLGETWHPIRIRILFHRGSP